MLCAECLIVVMPNDPCGIRTRPVQLERLATSPEVERANYYKFVLWRRFQNEKARCHILWAGDTGLFRSSWKPEGPCHVRLRRGVDSLRNSVFSDRTKQQPTRLECRLSRRTTSVRSTRAVQASPLSRCLHWGVSRVQNMILKPLSMLVIVM